MSRKQLRTENLIVLFERYDGATELARECLRNGVKIDPVTIGQIKNGTPLPSGNPRGVGDKLAEKLERGLNLGDRWMDTDHSSPVEISELHGNISQLTNKSGKPAILREVPLISSIQAGEWGDVVDNYNVGEGVEMMLCPVNHSENTFALMVDGDSMTSPYPGQKSYPHGTIIYVDPMRQIELGDRVVAKVNQDNKATFKVLAEDAGQRFLKPLNPQYKNIEINGNCRIVGKVIGAFTPE